MTADITKFGKQISGAFRNTPGLSGTSNGTNLADTANAIAEQLSLLQPGQPAAAVLKMGTNPTSADTVTIRSDVYEFLAAAGTVATDSNIGVLLAGTVAATRTNFINAINGDIAAATGILQSDGSPAARNGTNSLVADLHDTDKVRIRSADAIGGSPIGVVDASTVDEDLTAAADIWNVGATNAIQVGRAGSQAQLAVLTLTITASEITAGYVTFSPGNGTSTGMTPVAFIFQVRDSTGAVVEGYTDTFTIVEDSIKLTLAGGVGDIAATNVVTVLAACTVP
jgi:hypothetical protein